MSATPKRILIVDDDSDYVFAISAFLESQGFSTLTASNGDEGVELARTERPDLILMDIMMNERAEGFRAVREIRREPLLRRVPIFVVSAFCTQLPDMDSDEEGWMAHDAFLSKPVDLPQLLEKVRRWTGA
jgi:CheY-like chemotaxis protein